MDDDDKNDDDEDNEKEVSETIWQAWHGKGFQCQVVLTSGVKMGSSVNWSDIHHHLHCHHQHLHHCHHEQYPHP